MDTMVLFSKTILDKCWVVEKEDSIVVYWTKPRKEKSYEAIVKIIPIERTAIDKVSEDMSAVVGEMSMRVEKMKKAAESLKRTLERKK